MHTIPIPDLSGVSPLALKSLDNALCEHPKDSKHPLAEYHHRKVGKQFCGRQLQEGTS